MHLTCWRSGGIKNVWPHSRSCYALPLLVSLAVTRSAGGVEEGASPVPLQLASHSVLFSLEWWLSKHLFPQHLSPRRRQTRSAGGTPFQRCGPSSPRKKAYDDSNVGLDAAASASWVAAGSVWRGKGVPVADVARVGRLRAVATLADVGALHVAVARDARRAVDAHVAERVLSVVRVDLEHELGDDEVAGRHLGV